MNNLVINLKKKKNRSRVLGLIDLSVLNPFVLKYNGLVYCYTLMLNVGKDETYYHGYQSYDNWRVLRVSLFNKADFSLLSYSYYCPSMFVYVYF